MHGASKFKSGEVLAIACNSNISYCAQKKLDIHMKMLGATNTVNAFFLLLIGL